MSHRWNIKNIWCDRPAANAGEYPDLDVGFKGIRGERKWKNGRNNFETASIPLNV